MPPIPKHVKRIMERMAPPLTIQEHRAKWRNCQLCPLSKTRCKVVLYRGRLPCDVLFLGEGPGDAEDIQGSPFRGPAGKLLDEIIDEALHYEDSPNFANVRIAFSNIVACLPKDDSGPRPPTRAEAEACRPRLQEFLDIAAPRLTITLGKEPDKFCPVPHESLVHPSAILRMRTPGQQKVAYDRCVQRIHKWIEAL